MPKKMLITGASGFIATHCILELLKNGYDVKGTVRNLNRTGKIQETLRKKTSKADAIEFVRAELTDAVSLEKAVKGCSGVLHIASPAPIMPPKNADEVIIPAREGALNVLKAAKKFGIPRVVMTSSAAAVGGRGREVSRTYSESDWANINDPDQSPYSLSKTIAESAAWEFVKKHGVPELAIINPSFVFGPALEEDYGSSLEILYRILSGKYLMVPKLGFEIVDVRDVAVLHRLAYESPDANGRRFLCSSGYRWMKDICIFLKENFPKYRGKISIREMPNCIFKVIAIFDRSAAMFVPKLEVKKELDTSPAREVLGWTPRSPEESIKSGAQSLIDLGII